MKKAILMLEDGSSFEGISIGSPDERAGEVMLYTSVVGYQEIMSDPANAGKIVVLTYPLIGNYGIAGKFNESDRCWISGLIIREESRIYSNWQAEGSLGGFLKENNITAMAEVDTRTLAVRIRDHGQMFGIISSKDDKKTSLMSKIERRKKEGTDFIKKISVEKARHIKGSPGKPLIAVMDIGMLNSFVKQLTALGCNTALLPYNTPAEAIFAMKPDGLIISGGPENDAAIPEVVRTIKKILGKVPIMGISTGHQVLGLALGGTLKKMKIGHHGVNYPVKSPDLFKGEITVQNHSFVIDEKSIKNLKGVNITMRNVNDGSIEEMESKAMRFISVQYYPASPGFNEVNTAFTRFLKLSKKESKKEVVHAKA